MAHPLRRRPLPRRTFLRAASASIALPMLDAMSPAFARGAVREPQRAVFVFLPNGVHMQDWTPATAGTEFELPWILEPLAPLRDRVQVLSGLALDGARAHGDGPGDHARAAASFLTTAHPRKTGGAELQAGVSVDQKLGQFYGDATAFRTLELGTERGRASGSCDSGYSCAYSNNISWRDPATPCPKEVDPSKLFERLFGTRRSERELERLKTRRSVLDLVLEDVRDLRRELGPGDVRKLDEYLTSLREVERRVDAARDEDAAVPGARIPDLPRGIPRQFAEHLGLLFDLAVLALASDRTRVVSVMAGNAGSNRKYRELEISEGHHTLSHHGKDPAKHAALRKINRHHVEAVARLLTRLADENGPHGDLLASTTVVCGSAIADGNRHAHHDLPVFVAGGQARGFGGGRHRRYERETPMANLYLTLLQRAGLEIDAFGDSDGPLDV